ncbi:MAG TPA: hypothetical protein VFQ38_24530 [Longimicrobiales bacterium]|nr:hypothetical protein [Longimicrobiales bacterium]
MGARQGVSFISIVLVGAAALLVAGCQSDGAAKAEAEPPAAAARASVPGGLIPGTPAGGLQDWITDVRRGLAAAAERSASDPAGAQRQALELYLTRQEYIEQYYGTGGRLNAGPALGPAVKAAEDRFHEVLQQMRPGAGSAAGGLAGGVARLSAQYDTVLAAAKSAGVPLLPRGDAAAPSGAP